MNAKQGMPRRRRTKAQMAADVAPNLFVNVKERNYLIRLVRAASPGGDGKPFAKLVAKLEGV